MSDADILNDAEFIKLRKAASIYDRREIQWYNKISRFGYVNPYNTLKSTREYLFFTKPDLHLFNNGDPAILNPQIANIPFFREMHSRYRNVLKQLQNSYNHNDSPFMNLITNSVNSGMALPSIVSMDSETGANIYGSTIKYRWTSVESDNDYDFSLEFEDSKYLEVYMMFKAFDEYERQKAMGIITPPNDNYIVNKILHDQVAVYKIIVGEDGETIIHYAKAYGVYSKDVPRDVFSSLDKNGGLTFSVNFNSTFIEDMDPLILTDFNSIVSRYIQGKPDIPLYDVDNHVVNGDWCNIPYITLTSASSSSIHPMTLYKLRWR